MPKKGLITKVGTSTTDGDKKDFASSGIEGTKELDKKPEAKNGK
jgi:hypothetical protein